MRDKEYYLNKANIIVLFALTCIMFFYMVNLNHLVPMESDDYANSYVNLNYDNGKISNLNDVIKSTILIYFGWTGRFFSSFFVFLSTMLGKDIFNVFNAFIYTSLVVLIFIYKDIDWINKKSSIPMYILTIFLCWFGLPRFGETVLWLVGSIVYLWSTFALLLFLLPYRYLVEGKYILSDRISSIAIMLLSGLACGGTLENVVPIVLALIFIYYIYLKKAKMEIPKWYYSGFISLTLSFIVSILSPGNFLRYKVEQTRLAGTSVMNKGFSDFVSNILIVIKEQYVIFLVLLLVLIIKFIFITNNNKRYVKNRMNTLITITLLLGGISSWLIMCLSPIFPIRTSFFGAILMIISILLTINIWDTQDINNKIVSVLIVGLLVVTFTSKYYVLEQYRILNIQHLSRITDINRNIERGIYNVIVPRYEVIYNRHVWPWDISYDSSFAENKFYAKYYGLNSIKTTYGKKISSNSKLVVMLKNENYGSIYKVQYDLGSGFNIAYGEYLAPSNEYVKFIVNVPDEDLKRLKINFSTGANITSIKSISYIKDQKEYFMNSYSIKNNFKIENYKELVEKDGTIIINGDDINMVFDIPSDLDFVK